MIKTKREIVGQDEIEKQREKEPEKNVCLCNACLCSFDVCKCAANTFLYDAVYLRSTIYV